MKRWYKYIKPYLSSFILGPICMIIEVIGEVVMPILFAQVINGLTGAESDSFIPLPIPDTLGVMGAMILVAILMMAGGIGGAYFGAKASVGFATDLRQDAYLAVQRYSFANIDKFSTGSLVTRLTNDVTQMQNFVNMLLRMALRTPGIMIGALIMAISLNPPLSVVLAVTIPLMIITVGAVIVKGFPLFRKMQTRLDELNATVQENITNVRVVKSFVREGHEESKFHVANNNMRAAGFQTMKLMIHMEPIISLFMYLTTLAVIWLGADRVISHGMLPGDLSAFMIYVTQILSSLMMVTMLLMMVSRSSASAKRLREVLEEVPDIRDDAADSALVVRRGEIEFRDVSFRYYKNSEEPVLDRISLHIAAGETVGIIGSTGCGKTTLISMITRLYDPDEGQVLVDGVDVKEYSLRHLRDGIGVVLQKNTLFSGTIAENLRWGNEDATDEEMIEAATHAQAHKFVVSFPDGYETILEQGGKNVSGGQKQRLCIARALLKKPRVLILDDSTSAVDTATEAQIRQALRESLGDTTKIIIAQRITSVMDADKIIVMNDGAITGIGTHAELLATNEDYLDICRSQGRGEEGAV